MSLLLFFGASQQEEVKDVQEEIQDILPNNLPQGSLDLKVFGNQASLGNA